MKVLRLFVLCLFVVSWDFVLHSQVKSPIYDQLRRPLGTAFYHTPLGLCEDYPEETTTPAIIRNDMELLKRSGIHLLRISFGWDAIEESKDKYNWLFWDDYVKMANEEYGITLIPYICYTPSWNSTGDSTNFWNHTPKDYEEFGQFVFDLVTRYKKWIKSWELWNEPDIKEYWSGSVQDYARLAKIGSDAVRKADPTALVVLGGLAHNTNFTRTLFRDLGISPYVDIVNMHNYNETWSGTPNELVTDYINTMADIVQTYGNGQSLWVAEIGYSTFRKDGRVSDSYNAYYDYEHTPKYQAVHLIRTLAMALSTEKVAAIAWYEVKDLTSQEDVIGDDNNRHLGVATLRHEPKPAEHALVFFHKLFAKKVRSIDKTILVTRSVGSESEIHSFESDDGDVYLVGWLKTHVRGHREKDQKGLNKDKRSETIELRIPLRLSGKAMMYDELGKSTEFRTVVRKTETVVNNWVLRGGEVSILTIAKVRKAR